MHEHSSLGDVQEGHSLPQDGQAVEVANLAFGPVTKGTACFVMAVEWSAAQLTIA